MEEETEMQMQTEAMTEATRGLVRSAERLQLTTRGELCDWASQRASTGDGGQQNGLLLSQAPINSAEEVKGLYHDSINNTETRSYGGDRK